MRLLVPFLVVLSSASFAVAEEVKSRLALSGNSSEHLDAGIMLRSYCVEAFPKFKNTPNALSAESLFTKRSGARVWDHKNLAITISLKKLDGRDACVMSVISKRWKEDFWAKYAIPAFGATWESDKTIVDLGKGKPGDNAMQHIRVQYPTKQLFTFDAEKRDDGYWTLTIAIIAAK